MNTCRSSHGLEREAINTSGRDTRQPSSPSSPATSSLFGGGSGGRGVEAIDLEYDEQHQQLSDNDDNEAFGQAFFLSQPPQPSELQREREKRVNKSRLLSCSCCPALAFPLLKGFMTFFFSLRLDDDKLISGCGSAVNPF